ncbi:MAG TPA: hypothetical protein VNT92_07390 [Acidimicrobiia bacterium]|nr:hypothetical protein [Acidimicrobiia bacterium]
MASRRGLAAFVAPLLILVACTESATPPQPTAPPDAFAPTPTIGPSTTTRPAPTTTLNEERVLLRRVDPVSLDPITTFEPIPMGDWLWGPKTSPDGRYLAATINQESAPNSELRLIDIQSWVPVTSWPESGDFIVHVNEFGSVYFITYRSSPEFRMAAVDGAESTLVVALANTVSVWGAEHLSDEEYVIFGTHMATPSGPEQALVGVVDANTRTVEELALPAVGIGAVDPESQGPWASYLYTSPSFTLDRTRPRVLIVHGDEDVVTELDLSTGQATEHPFESSAAGSPETGARRWSAISPDGQFLYVSTRAVELIEDDDNWLVRTRPGGVTSLDTSTWEVVARTDEPISDVYVSPGGDRLLASGYTTEESETVSRSESSGLYLLDPSDLSVLTHYPAERQDQGWGPVTFSEAGSIAYVSTWLGMQRVHALELATGEMLSTAENLEFLDMIGPVGVLASTG